MITAITEQYIWRRSDCSFCALCNDASASSSAAHKSAVKALAAKVRETVSTLMIAASASGPLSQRGLGPKTSL